MTINPSSPNGPSRPVDPAELERTRARPAEPVTSPVTKKDAVDSDDQKLDSVQVSSEARALADPSGARPPRGTLPPERLQQIGERLATGFYDRPEVIDELAKRLVNHSDLRSPE